MTIETPFAIDQFVNDFTIVTDNDRTAYYEIIDTVRAHKKAMPAISDALREGWEEQIAKAVDVLRQSGEVEGVTIDIMNQMLTGWGSSAFDQIARHYIEKDEE